MCILKETLNVKGYPGEKPLAVFVDSTIATIPVLKLSFSLVFHIRTGRATKSSTSTPNVCSAMRAAFHLHKDPTIHFHCLPSQSKRVACLCVAGTSTSRRRDYTTST